MREIMFAYNADIWIIRCSLAIQESLGVPKIEIAYLD